MTRGEGWGAPYQVGEEAADALSLPPHNPGTAVREVTPKSFKLLDGPEPVKPEFNRPGGGVQYKQ